MSLKARLIFRCIVAVGVCAAVLFFTAGTWRYPQGWTFLALLFIPMLASSVYFYQRDPKLVERRLQTKEKIGKQKIIMRLGTVIGFGAYLLPGLDFRFGWTRGWFGPEPLWLVICASALFLAAYLLTYWVMFVNSYASRTIQVEAGQEVISSGPYRLVRHPMYFGGVLTMLFAPLVLGSYVALPMFAVVIPVIVFRLLNEEKVLRNELPGYSEYCDRTRYRLVPYVW